MNSTRAEGARLAYFMIVVEVNMNKLIPFGFPYKNSVYIRALPHLAAPYERSFLHVPR